MTYKNLSYTEIATEAQGTGFNWFADRDIDIANPVVSDAIPSPFCRIEMVDQAFKWVNKKFREANNDRLLQNYALGADNAINGYHRIISECLDVAMMFCYKNIFFNNCEKVEIGTDFAKKLQDLQNRYEELKKRQANNNLSREQEVELKTIVGEIRFNNALNMFEREDRIFENKMNPMVLLKWENVVVGGTSPISLFVAAKGVKERLLRECRIRYNCNNENERIIMDKYFPKFEDYTLFHDYRPFFKRSADFQQFVYDNAYTVAGMSSFREYINNCLKYQNLLGLAPLQDNDNAAVRPNYIEVPVLKYEDNRQNTTYLKKTISSDDLFEDYIVETRYPIDSDKFKCLRDSNTHQKIPYYFLPLRKEFFRLFGKNAADNVTVAVNISKVNDQTKKTIECFYTQNNVTYRKTYKDENLGERGYGKIKKMEDDTIVSLSFLPFIKPSENQEGRVAVYTANCRIDDVKFYSERDGEFTVNSEGGLDLGRLGMNSQCFTLRKEYDCINLAIADHDAHFSVFVVPELLNLNEGNNRGKIKFNFSVDIGTTNTYIAYNECSGNNYTDPAAFDSFKDNENLFVNLYKYSSTQSGKDECFIATDLGKFMALECLPPDKFSLRASEEKKEKIKFPLRTVIWQKRNNSGNNIFSDRGLDFIHETILPHDYDEIEYKTGYKWGEEATSLLKATIDELVIMIRAFVELKGGKVEKLSTFYPVSMDDRLKKDLKAHWNECCRKKLNMPTKNNGDTQGFYWVSESEAPMLYYSKVEHNENCQDLGVAVDIGGGSTDIAIYDREGNLSAVTSFQFAGDVIFGNKLNIVKNIDENNKYYARFNELQRKKSNLSDLHSYLFSIPKEIFNYSEFLTHNKRFTLTVYYFYAAILFHVCAFLKANGHNLLPSAVVFSGNGSKILSLIDRDKFRRFTIDFMKKCLVSAEQNGNQDDVEICLKDSPKVITAEGGLYATENSDTDIETVLFPGKNDCSKMTFVEAGKQDAKKACLDEINKFNGIFFEVGKKDFEAGQLNFLKQYAETNLNAKRNGAENETFFDFWYDKKLRETENRYRMHDRDFSNENSLQETTFFFPIRFIIDKALENVETRDAKNK